MNNFKFQSLYHDDKNTSEVSTVIVSDVFLKREQNQLTVPVNPEVHMLVTLLSKKVERNNTSAVYNHVCTILEIYRITYKIYLQKTVERTKFVLHFW